jgi:hypothetical protein
VTAVTVVDDGRDARAPDEREEPVDRRRYGLGLCIWVLLFANGLAFTQQPILIPLPTVVGKIATQGALELALALALVFNRRKVLRPNLFLVLVTLLAASSLMMSVRMATGLGMLYRAGRFGVFVAILWLLTPLWGRRDRILLRWHMWCLGVVLASVAIGGVIAPGRALQIQGRLSGQIWPIPPTQVGHYAAVLAGISFVLLLSGAMRVRPALFIGGSSVVILLFTHTRTALIALIAAVVCAMLSLITSRRRARRTAAAMLVAVVLGATVFAPAVSTWFSRGQSAQLVGQLNGRREVWNDLVVAPRSRFTELFGMGLTNKSFGGLPIDNSWLASYQDQGLFGVAICAALLVSLLMLAATRPRGPCVAVAIFLIVYSAIASLTETGLGDVSPYLLDLAVAAALLAVPGDGVLPPLIRLDR